MITMKLLFTTDVKKFDKPIGRNASTKRIHHLILGLAARDDGG